MVSAVWEDVSLEELIAVTEVIDDCVKLNFAARLQGQKPTRRTHATIDTSACVEIGPRSIFKILLKRFHWISLARFIFQVPLMERVDTRRVFGASALRS